MGSRLFIAFLCFSAVFSYEDVTVAEYFLNGDYIFLKNLMEQARLTDTLSEAGPFTVFAPSDMAFAEVGEETLNQYSTAQLAAVAEYHIVQGYILVGSLTAPTSYTTILGKQMDIVPVNQTLLLNNASYVDRFENDIILRNGVIQPIDVILRPPGDVLTTFNIAQVLLHEDSKFHLFYVISLLSDMDTVFEGGEYTLFAPTDAAFNAFEGNLLDPSEPEFEAIYREVIRYHLIPGGRRAKQLRNGTLVSLQGTALTITTDDAAGVSVNGVPVVEPDIYATNGMIHAIDTILIPEGLVSQIRKAAKLAV